MNGSLALWDLLEYKLLKYVPSLHSTEVTKVKVYQVSTNSHHISVISSEQEGAVRITEISKKALFGGYSVNSEFLFKTRIQGTTAIALFEPNKLYPQLFCDNSKLTAVGGVNLVAIVTLKPVDCLYTIEKPLLSKDKSLPYLAWGFGLTPSQRESTFPMLAVAWDKLI
jgi:hypothetical protein